MKWGCTGHDREFGFFSTGCGKPVVSSVGVTQSGVLAGFEEEGLEGRSRSAAGSLLRCPGEKRRARQAASLSVGFLLEGVDVGRGGNPGKRD